MGLLNFIKTTRKEYKNSLNKNKENFYSLTDSKEIVVNGNTYISNDQEAIVYLSPSGDDNNTGVYDSPMKTIQGAIDRYKRYGHITINLSPGAYAGFKLTNANYLHLVTLGNRDNTSINSAIGISYMSSLYIKDITINVNNTSYTEYGISAIFSSFLYIDFCVLNNISGVKIGRGIRCWYNSKAFLSFTYINGFDTALSANDNSEIAEDSGKSTNFNNKTASAFYNSRIIGIAASAFNYSYYSDGDICKSDATSEIFPRHPEVLAFPAISANVSNDPIKLYRQGNKISIAGSVLLKQNVAANEPFININWKCKPIDNYNVYNNNLRVFSFDEVNAVLGITEAGLKIISVNSFGKSPPFTFYFNHNIIADN